MVKLVLLAGTTTTLVVSAVEMPLEGEGTLAVTAGAVLLG